MKKISILEAFDPYKEEFVPIKQAINQGLFNSSTYLYFNPLEKKHYSITEAEKNGFLRLAIDQRSEALIVERIKVSQLVSLVSARDPENKDRLVPINQAIYLGIIDTKAKEYVDSAQDKRIELGDAFDADLIQGNVVNEVTEKVTETLTEQKSPENIGLLKKIETHTYGMGDNDSMELIRVNGVFVFDRTKSVSINKMVKRNDDELMAGYISDINSCRILDSNSTSPIIDFNDALEKNLVIMPDSIIFEQNVLYVVDVNTGNKLDFEAACEIGLIDIKHKTFKDTKSNKSISLFEALAKNYIVMKDELNTNYNQSEIDNDDEYDDSHQITYLDLKSMFDPSSGIQVTIKKAIELAILSKNKLFYVDTMTGKKMSLYQAVEKGLAILKPEKVKHKVNEGYQYLIIYGVYNPVLNKEMTLSEAINAGFLDHSESEFHDPLTGKTMSLLDAYDKGYLKTRISETNDLELKSDTTEPDQSLTIRESDTMMTRQARIEQQNDIMSNSKLTNKSFSLSPKRNSIRTKFRSASAYDVKSTDKLSTLSRKSVVSKIMNKFLGKKSKYNQFNEYLIQESMKILDTESNQFYSLRDAIERHLLKPEDRIVDCQTKQDYSIVEAIQQGLIKFFHPLNNFEFKYDQSCAIFRNEFLLLVNYVIEPRSKRKIGLKSAFINQIIDKDKSVYYKNKAYDILKAIQKGYLSCEIIYLDMLNSIITSNLLKYYKNELEEKDKKNSPTSPLFSSSTIFTPRTSSTNKILPSKLDTSKSTNLDVRNRSIDVISNYQSECETKISEHKEKAGYRKVVNGSKSVLSDYDEIDDEPRLTSTMKSSSAYESLPDHELNLDQTDVSNISTKTEVDFDILKVLLYKKATNSKYIRFDRVLKHSLYDANNGTVRDLNDNNYYSFYEALRRGLFRINDPSVIFDEHRLYVVEFVLANSRKITMDEALDKKLVDKSKGTVKFLNKSYTFNEAFKNGYFEAKLITFNEIIWILNDYAKNKLAKIAKMDQIAQLYTPILSRTSENNFFIFDNSTKSYVSIEEAFNGGLLLNSPIRVRDSASNSYVLLKDAVIKGLLSAEPRKMVSFKSSFLTHNRKSYIVDCVFDPRKIIQYSLSDAIKTGVFNNGIYKNFVHAKLLTMDEAIQNGYIKAKQVNLDLIEMSLKKTLTDRVFSETEYQENCEMSIGKNSLDVKRINREKKSDVEQLELRMKPFSGRIVSVQDVISGKYIKVDDAIKYGLINFQEGIFTNSLTNETMSINDGMNRGFVLVESSKKKLESRRRAQSLRSCRTLISDKDSIDFLNSTRIEIGTELKILSVLDPIRKDNMKLNEAIDAGIFDVNLTMYVDPRTNKRFTLPEAIEQNLIKIADSNFRPSFKLTVNQDNQIKIISIRFIVDSFTKQIQPVNVAYNKKLINLENGTYVGYEKIISLEEAYNKYLAFSCDDLDNINSSRAKFKVVCVRKSTTGKNMSLKSALAKNWINLNRNVYIDKMINQEIYFSQAVDMDLLVLKSKLNEEIFQMDKKKNSKERSKSKDGYFNS